MRTFAISILLLIVTGMFVSTNAPLEFTLRSAEYIGSDACISCHQGMNPDLVTNYQNSGHPYKLNAVDGDVPFYPAHTTPGPVTPPGTSWSDFAYVIGGYGWKARFIKPDGRIYTVGDSAQYNLANSSWVAYHEGEDKKYNYGCFQCHTTGASPEGSWNGVADDSLGTFTEPGVRCEGCHGPGGDHAQSPSSVKPPIDGDDLKLAICASCHQRGGTTNAIPAKGGYIRHHEQSNEMAASAHGDGMNVDLTCASCHDAHVPGRYPDVAIDGTEAITVQCETCHAGKEVMVDGNPKQDVTCIDCHMAQASKSALGFTMGNGYQGDVKTHIWGINSSAVPRDSMFTAEGFVALDANGHAAVTLDFACLACHTNQDLNWAANYAQAVHDGGINTDIETDAVLPADYALNQNYPNPFNPQTTIGFNLPEAASVTLRIFSVDGREVASVLNQRMPAGVHQVTVTSGQLSSGTYLYELVAGTFKATKTMVVLK